LKQKKQFLQCHGENLKKEEESNIKKIAMLLVQ
jgi:hypothetical protein